ncbi:polysaccharide lyase family protein [Saccharopolyspora soli]|uniref:polysaccharide lyase family protein n=1 Tax=Saccharopolyspora soli TaxID=2926618 RepID=UPI0035576F63
MGKADRTSGEYALATGSPARPGPRAYEKPAGVPGDLTFVVGSDWEPTDWYYAQTNSGTWTIIVGNVPLGAADRINVSFTANGGRAHGTAIGVARG